MISILLPCRNEEKAIPLVIPQIKRALKEYKYEIIVSDSSTDNSPKLARKLGARVVKHNKKGYGRAYLEALAFVKGDIVVVGDCDGTYDFLSIPKLIDKVQSKTIVMGRRVPINSQAMPLAHRFIGTPLLSFAISALFGRNIRDINSGFRAMYTKDLLALDLQTTGMEFASEMLIQAMIQKYKIVEIDTLYFPRIGESKLDTLTDGWRHLRFIMPYAPLQTYLLMGGCLFILGFVFMLASLSGSLTLFGLELFRSISFVGSTLALSGFTIASLGLIAKVFLKSKGLLKEEKMLRLLASVPFELLFFPLLALFLSLSTVFGFIIYDWLVYNLLLNTNSLVFLLTTYIIVIQGMLLSLLISLMLVETKG